jgi:hypothetical protein
MVILISNSTKATLIARAKSVVTIPTEWLKEYNMDFIVRIVEGVGEVGIDTEASPGNGKYYIKHYASGLDEVGFDTEEEALTELEFINDSSMA